jgi:hypothetical protein
MKKVNRRDFLKIAAVGAAMVALTACGAKTVTESTATSAASSASASSAASSSAAASSAAASESTVSASSTVASSGEAASGEAASGATVIAKDGAELAAAIDGYAFPDTVDIYAGGADLSKERLLVTGVETLEADGAYSVRIYNAMHEKQEAYYVIERTTDPAEFYSEASKLGWVDANGNVDYTAYGASIKDGVSKWLAKNAQ